MIASLYGSVRLSGIKSLTVHNPKVQPNLNRNPNLGIGQSIILAQKYGIGIKARNITVQCKTNIISVFVVNHCG